MCNREQKTVDGEREAASRKVRARRKPEGRMRALASVLLTLTACMPSGYAQQIGAGSSGPDKAASVLPAAPVPE